MSRIGLDLAFGLYRKRVQWLTRMDLLKDNPDIIDVGCGIGKYSKISHGNYLGIDTNAPFISFAAKKYRKKKNVAFLCEDISLIQKERLQGDIILMVDFLHHIADAPAVGILNTVSKLNVRYIINFEPVTEQNNVIGDWIIRNDQGDYVRPVNDLLALYARPESGLEVIKSEKLALGPIMTHAILAKPKSGNR